MSEIVISISTGEPQNEIPQPNIRQLIKWDNPIAIADGYSVWSRLVNNQVTGQFGMCPVFITDLAGAWEHTWSSNALATSLTHDQYMQISRLQVPDANNTVDDKMNWAAWGGTGKWGSVIKATWAEIGETWRDARGIQLLGTVYAGQLITVVERATLLIEFNGQTTWEPMVRIQAYDPEHWSDPFATQLVTTVNRFNEYGENPRGKVRMPIYFGRDRIGWMFERWLEPK